jgi:sucrose phosphorylase
MWSAATTGGMGEQEAALDRILKTLYPRQSSEERQTLSSHLLHSVEGRAGIHTQPAPGWMSTPCVLICYADSVVSQGASSLPCLTQLLNRHLAELSAVVHVLPFLKATSDGGFAVASHERLEPRFGSWNDLADLAAGRALMADLVLNHVSAAHRWVQQCLLDQEPGRSCVLEAGPDPAWADVVRPRSSALFTTLAGRSGPHSLWTTFGPDQVDVNWREPQVLQHFAALMQRLFSHGVSWLRLDAVGFIWKEPFTPCIHRPEAHQIVALLRLVQEQHRPGGVIVTETNVPEQENLSYLRPGNEAHLAYNFPLPPLLLEAALSERTDLLNRWLERWPALPPHTGLLNFTASHDGVGLRPLEGLMEEQRLLALLINCERRGGLISHRRLPDGREVPYEINISWWSAMGDGGRDSSRWQQERFLLTQLFLLALPGVPAFYLPALLASANDTARFRATGQRRDLNRPQFNAEQLEHELSHPSSPAAINIARLKAAMAVRARLPALAPEAPLRLCMPQRQDLVVIERGRGHQRLWAVHNFSTTRQSLPLTPMAPELIEGWIDHLNPAAMPAAQPTLTLQPLSVHWIGRP